jgi:signal transduction histidine kinase/DNA-binding NarL/FixJ family response regulator
MRPQTVNQFSKLLVVAWLTFSAGSVLLAVVSWSQLTARMRAGRQIMDTQMELNEVTRSLLLVLNAERGYVITGDKMFIGRFDRVTGDLPLQFDRLVNLVHDDPQMLQQVMQLRTETELGLAGQREVMAARDKNFGAAAALIAAGTVQSITDKALAQASALDQICRDKRMLARQDVVSRVWHANVTTLFAGGFGIGAGLLALWLSYAAAKHQKREYEQVDARLKAEHSNKEKSIFLANMSHEIRTPINAILGFSELLGIDMQSSKHKQYLQFIRSSADSLLQLINDILDLSKIEAGVMSLYPEPTDLREICDFIRTLFSEPAAKRNVTLECHITDDLPHAIMIDRIRFRQILANLVGNAVKFTDHGQIDVRFDWKKEPAGRMLLIVEVQDSGVGIPPDKLDVIFKPFIQSGAHREKEKQGTGLGLSIVKHLTEAMGGAVTVDSVMGQGSIFQVRFPNIPISARLAASGKLVPSAKVDFNELRPATLLVVDDNETNCQLIAGMFAGSHHRLFFGSNGEEAVAKASKFKPDVILMDIRMPGMNGHEALAAIRKFAGLELTPSIAITASALQEEENSLKKTFSGYLRKPFSQRQLFDELSEFLPRSARTVSAAKAARLVKAENSDQNPIAKQVAEDLLSQLRLLIIDPWPTIRDSVAINESKDFAHGLEGLGQRWQCPPLVNYAKKILEDAENYAVEDLEKHLGEFSALVEQLGHNAR